MFPMAFHPLTLTLSPHGREGMPCGDFFGLLDKQCCFSLLNPPFPLYTGAGCNHSPRLARVRRVPPR